VYSTADTQALIKRVNKLLAGCRDTLKETLELEDYDEEGALPASAFREAFSTLDLAIEADLLDFVFFVVYQKSESLEKLRYAALFELIDGKLPGLNATASEGGRKRPESSSPEKLKARNKEKFQAADPDAEKQAAKARKTAAKEDDYEEEFEQLLDKDDEEGDDEAVGQMAGEVDVINKSQEKLEEKEKEQEDDDYIDEEEMLDIAERCFVRIAEAILDSGISVRQAFSPFIIQEDFEGEALELLSPIGFLEGVKELGVTDLEEVEVACLMRVLTKADLENAILLRELIVIMENFGIQDDGSAEVAESAAQEDTAPNDDSATKKGGKRKKAAAQLDLAQLDEKSVKILAKLMLALMELNVSLYDFFEGAIYE